MLKHTADPPPITDHCGLQKPFSPCDHLPDAIGHLAPSPALSIEVGMPTAEIMRDNMMICAHVREGHFVSSSSACAGRRGIARGCVRAHVGHLGDALTASSGLLGFVQLPSFLVWRGLHVRPKRSKEGVRQQKFENRRLRAMRVY